VVSTPIKHTPEGDGAVPMRLSVTNGAPLGTGAKVDGDARSKVNRLTKEDVQGREGERERVGT